MIDFTVEELRAIYGALREQQGALIEEALEHVDDRAHLMDVAEDQSVNFVTSLKVRVMLKRMGVDVGVDLEK